VIAPVWLCFEKEVEEVSSGGLQEDFVEKNMGVMVESIQGHFTIIVSFIVVMLKMRLACDIGQI